MSTLSGCKSAGNWQDVRCYLEDLDMKSAGGRRVRRRHAKLKARGRILVVIWGSEGAREACKIERLRLDSIQDLGVGGCARGVQN